MPTLSEYEAWQRQLQEQDAAKANVVIDGQTMSPDEMAEAVNIGDEFGKATGQNPPPPEMVSNNKSTFLQRLASRARYQVLSNSPRLSGWMQNPQNAALGSDDVDSLSLWEHAAMVPRGAVAGVGRVIAGSEWYGGVGANKLGFNNVGEWLKQDSLISSRVNNIIAGNLDGIDPNSLNPNEQSFIKTFRPQQGWADSILEGGGEGVGMALPMLATGGAGAGALATAGAGALPFALASGESGARAEQEGLTEGQALGFAGRNAGIATLINAIPAGKFAAALGAGTPLAKALLERMAMHVGMVPAMTVLNDLNEWRTLNPDKTLGDFIKEQPAAIGNAVAMAALSDAMISGGAHVAGMVRSKVFADHATEGASIIEQLGKMAEASKLRERSPKKFGEWVQKAVENTNAENLYVPADKFAEYFQSKGIDPHALAEGLTGMSGQDFDAALATGGDVKVPLSTYASEVTGSGHEPFFAENGRFNPDAMTASEAAEFNAKATDALQEAFDEAEQLRLQEEASRPHEQEIFETMKSRLQESGRASDVATHEAMLTVAAYKTLAERDHMTLEDLLRQYPLPKVAGELPQGMQTKDVDALTRTIEEARAAKTTGDKRQGILEFIDAHGGINDLGGELKARNAERVSMGPGKKTLKLSRSNGRDMLSGVIRLGRNDGRKYGPDDVAQAIIDAGYLGDHPVVNEYKRAQAEGRQVPDITSVLWDAVDRELAGDKQFSAHDQAPKNTEHLDNIERYLNDLGVSLDDSNDTIRAAVEGDQAKRLAQADGDKTPTGPDGRTALFDRLAGDWKRHVQAIREGRAKREMNVLRDAPVLRTWGVKGTVKMDPIRAAKIMSDHPDVPRQAWDYLPELMADPVAVFMREGRAVVVLDAQTAKGEPIIAAVEPNKGDVLTITPYHNTEGETGLDRLNRYMGMAANNPGRIYLRTGVSAEATGAPDAQSPKSYRGVGSRDLPASVVQAGLSYALGRKLITRDDVLKSAHRIFFQPAAKGAAFDRWFAGSQAVDVNGDPLVLFHGSPDARFLKPDDAQFKGPAERFGQSSAGGGVFWFASDRRVANTYADARRAFDYQNAEPGTGAFYLSMKNPLVVDAAGAEWREAQARGKTSDVIEQAKAAGHDGVIIRNVRDNYNGNEKARATDTYAVFRPEQIKSAVGNHGTYSPNDPRILYQPAWHGSPHLFERFSTEHIGRGEGAQAYGWGLYFAGHKGVAEFYRKKLSGSDTINVGGTKVEMPMPQLGSDISRWHYLLDKLTPHLKLPDDARLPQEYKGSHDVPESVIGESAASIVYALRHELNELHTTDPSVPVNDLIDARLKYVLGRAKEATENRDAVEFYKHAAVLRALKDVGVDRGTPGRLFKVDIPHDDELLDYEARFDKQPVAVQKALAELGFGKPAKPAPIKDAKLASIVGKALKLNDGEARNLALVIDNDSRLYREATDWLQKKGHTEDDIDSFGGTGALIELEAANYLDALDHGNGMTGEKMYRRLSHSLGDDEAASRALMAKGVPGLRYLDNFSRAGRSADDGTHNYVIFDDGRVKVTEFEQPGSDAFKSWFGGSKVTDASGEPIKVYHHGGFDENLHLPDGAMHFGTEQAARERAFGKVTDDAISAVTAYKGGDGRWHWDDGSGYTSEEAGHIGFHTEEQAKAAGRVSVAEMDPGADADVADLGNTTAAYLSIKNPKRVPDQGADWTAAIEQAKAEGYDGIVYRNQFEDKGSESWIAFEPTQIKSANNGGAYDPNNPNILGQADGGAGPRGSIAFPSAGIGNGDTVIRLFQNADLSTFIHESGHYFLSMMQDMAARGHESAGREYAIIKDWWHQNAADVARDASSVMADFKISEADVRTAIENGTTGDVMRDNAINVGMQEQWARAFEQYAMEGKAPSVGLRPAFERFKSWLTWVYKKLTGLGVNVSPELRGVFDRMLATDQEIEAAKQNVGDAPLFSSAEQMGVRPDEYQALMSLRQKADDAARAKMLLKVMAPIKRAQEKAYKEERARVRAETATRINSAPAYRAIEWLGNKRWLGEGKPEDMPEFRLSKADLVEQYGEGVLKTLPRGKQPVYAAEGGIHPDDAAGWFGFDSGDEMIRAMEKMPPREQAIDAETDKAMQDLHGDVLNDGTAEQEALAAVHNDDRARYLAAELKAITDVAQVGEPLTAKEARETARQAIGKLKTRDAINASRFLAAERKAAKEAARVGAMVARDKVWLDMATRRMVNRVKQASRGDASITAVNAAIERRNNVLESADTAFTTAKGEAKTAHSAGYNENIQRLVDAKRKQLLNHSLYSEALKVADEVERAEAFVQKLGSAKHRQKIAGAARQGGSSVDYLAAIDEVMERYDFKRLSAAAEQRKGALNTFVDAMKAAGRENELAIPDAVLLNAQRVPYKTLRVEELRGVVDTLKNLEHMALRWNNLVDAVNDRKLGETTDAVAAAFDANMPKRPPGRVNTAGERLRNTGRQFLDLVLNATTILREIDGFTDQGPAYTAIKGSIDEGVSRLTVRKEQAARDLEKLYGVYTGTERRAMANREHVPALGYSLSKWERIAVALNTGNEGNLQRLTDPNTPNHFTADQVKAVLDTLDERDAGFVQSVWDYLDTYRGDLAKRERRATGIEPQWVEASPVSIAGITLKGGYYPIKYDPRLSFMARDDETADITKTLAAGRFAKAQTRNGHLQERAKSSGRDVSLDMGVLHRHLNTMLYDLELSEAVTNGWRVLQDPKVRAKFVEAGRSADYEALETWMLDVGGGELKSADVVNRGARMLKSNFTAAKLAFNLATVATQVAGLTQSLVVVGKRDFARGVTAMFEKDALKTIVQKSPFMASRQTSFNKDISDMLENSEAGPVSSRWHDTKTTLGKAAFYLMTKVQFHAVDVPTWLAGYHQGLAKFGNDEVKAIAHADDVVKRAQSSGLFADRSAIERGSLTRQIRQNDVVRIFTALGSYMFAKLNVAYEQTAQTGRLIANEGLTAQSAAAAANWAVNMGLLFTVEAVIVAAIKGQLPAANDDDKHKWAKFLAAQTGLSVMGTLPVARDFASAVQGYDGGGAYGGFMGELAKPFVKASQGKADIRAIISATGLLTGLPATQINRIVDAAQRAKRGDDVSPAEYLLGRRSSK